MDSGEIVLAEPISIKAKVCYIFGSLGGGNPFARFICNHTRVIPEH